MRTRSVRVHERAQSDLRRIRDWIASKGSPVSARRYVEGIRDYIKTLGQASERGHSLDDVRVGLRLVSYRRANIAIHVSETTVTVVRVFRGGQDWDAALRRPGTWSPD